jgi:ribonuclease Z
MGGGRGISRRDSLRLSSLAMSGLALGGRSAYGADTQCEKNVDPRTRKYSYFDQLPPFCLNTPLLDNEMRITFLGSGFPPPRRAQAEMSVFVEVGPWIEEASGYGRATDSFVFDCGAGVATNYAAMDIQPSRMDKIFLAHLHGDHVSDLSHIYWYGPAGDRKSPLYVWGPGRSGITCPAWGDNPPKEYDDGTRSLCEGIRKALRWATESFAFQTTNYAGYNVPVDEKWVVANKQVTPAYKSSLLVPVDDDPEYDAYALIPIELDWTRDGIDKEDNVAYFNPTTGVKITHFPVIHCRKGSIGYRLEWNGMSMVFSSDTKPEYNSIRQGSGADVFIHEMILPAEELAKRLLRITDKSQVPAETWETVMENVTDVQNSSHTPQGAYGYLLSQMNPAPRLAVATHFTVADDTVELALKSVAAHVPGISWDWSGKILDEGRHPIPGTGNITWSTDLMVLRVFPDSIHVQKGVVNDFSYGPNASRTYSNMNRPKYDDGDPSDSYGDVYIQIDTSTAVPPSDPITGEEHYRTDGY